MEPNGPYPEAIQRAFQFAREHSRGCGPAEFLVGISEGEGPAAAALHPGPAAALHPGPAAALHPGPGRSLREVAAAPGPAREKAGYLHMQAQQAATELAAAQAQPAAPEHLLIALLDQGTPEVTHLLAQAGLDPATIRRAALAAIGAPADLPPIPLPALTPAGTLDRSPLPVADLDERAWAVLRWRQDHLPLARLRRNGDLQALIHLERAAAWRVAGKLGLDDDQRYSLVWQHAGRVAELIARTRTDLVGSERAAKAPRTRRPTIITGWAAWYSNRRVGLRDRWFRLRTAGNYRNCPQP